MINLIVACDLNRVIGKNGKLPWSIKEDWDYFMEKTSCGSMVMGKTCYYEFEPYADGRELIVLTHNVSSKFAKAKAANSLKHALALATHSPIWICGGEKLYQESMPIADRLYITKINHSFEGDVYFPDWEKPFPRMVSCMKLDTGKYNLEFMVFEKNNQTRS